MLHVSVAEARGLPVMESGGADPYCTLEFEGASYRTKTRSNTLAPKWEESFKFNVVDQSDKFTLHMLDSDLDVDDLIGRVMFTADEVMADRGENTGDKWWPIRPAVGGLVAAKMEEVGRPTNQRTTATAADRQTEALGSSSSAHHSMPPPLSLSALPALGCWVPLSLSLALSLSLSLSRARSLSPLGPSVVSACSCSMLTRDVCGLLPVGMCIDRMQTCCCSTRGRSRLAHPGLTAATRPRRPTPRRRSCCTSKST
eukprot:SAG22_NODE_3695_length_1572_cov_1.479973_3_plen_256_part_00